MELSLKFGGTSNWYELLHFDHLLESDSTWGRTIRKVIGGGEKVKKKKSRQVIGQGKHRAKKKAKKKKKVMHPQKNPAISN